jgi:GPH family glycoside/pentoside/hexuronide:cation symporter
MTPAAVTGNAVRSRTGAGAALPMRSLVAYGLFGMPLAMAALPLYVHVPQLYGAHFGVDLARLGYLLLALRLADALVDPLLGAWSDRLRDRRVAIAYAAAVLGLGMIALLAPAVRGEGPLLAWLGVSLALLYLAFSVATINHNAWGAELSDDPVERTRITATREGLALAGVVIASVAPTLMSDDLAQGLSRSGLPFAAVTAVALAALLAAPRPTRRPVAGRRVLASAAVPLRDPGFRKLLAVFVANGIAAAVPATLVLFFVADVLDASSRQGLFLALYFVAGAAGMPLWVRASAALGAARAWMVSMAVAVAAFVGATLLGSGDVVPFAAVCVASGFALGADLALPPALLADVIARRGAARDTGAYFGVWTLATKMNLALAAGIALPLLAALGYAPGTRSAAGLWALAVVYAGVPCALKLVALTALVRFDRYHPRTLP